MKTIGEVQFGFSDAENYRRRESKELFNKIFLKTHTLDQIDQRNIFFLVGEKGTGKTAYAVYYSNNQHRDNKAIHKFIRETDYLKFVSLRREKALNLSDYTDIWKVIIYVLISDSVHANATISDRVFKYPKLRALREAIDEYYNHAFSPEIPVALRLVEHSKLAAEIFAKHAGVGGKFLAGQEAQKTSDDKKFQTHLLELQRIFEECLSSLRLTDHHLLFIDGIDIRPSSVPYAEYLDCVKGLANAVWSINNDFFPGIKDSKGRLRVVLLLRPDIFNSLGLQNRNTKLKDNSVVLDWKCVYFSHRQSDLFKMADRMFSAQQDEVLMPGEAWDYYFPFNATNVRADENYPTSFILFLRYSFHRPRDILTILDTLKDLYVSNGSDKAHFEYKDLFTSDFKRRYGDYLLGEIKDSLSFYYDEKEFEYFLKFFEFLDGLQKFSYEKYLTAFEEFQNFLQGQNVPAPDFMRKPDEFLQFLYDQNILCFIEETEDERFIRWCFIERSPSNISPKVKTDTNYEIHYGLANVLNTGKEIKRNRRNVLGNVTKNRPSTTKPSESTDDLKPRKDERLAPQTETFRGVVKFFDGKKGYGFIVKDDGGEVYFRRSEFKAPGKIKKATRVEFRIEASTNGGRITAVGINLIE